MLQDNQAGNDLDRDTYKAQRLRELEHMDNLYPHSFRPTKSLSQFRTEYEHLNKAEIEPVEERLVGRIQTIRTSGSKLYFAILESNGHVLQILGNARHYTNQEDFDRDKRMLKRGDIVGVTGNPSKSNTGELSILPFTVQLLAPCLQMVPKETVAKPAFTDDGLRFAKRYLDFIVHPQNREIIKIRAKSIKFIRDYFDQKEFVEVETPVLSTKVGGANARPFTTFHNDLDMNMNMRIAPELYLKQLVIGGLERVYEIGKQFRNESIDSTHNPEFTTIEVYQAYSDYNDMLFTVEELLSTLVKDITGGHKISYNGVEVDFTPPFF